MRPNSRQRAWRRCAGPTVVLLLAIAVQVAGPAPTAAAHDRLLRSDPGADAVIPAPLSEIRLTFSEPIAAGFAAATLAVDDQPARPIDLRVDRATLIAIPPEPAPTTTQRWMLAYRIVSSDGHPLVGQVGFTVTAGGKPAASATTVTSNPASPRRPSAPTPASRPAWPWILPAVAVLFGGAVAFGFRLRRRAPGEDR